MPVVFLYKREYFAIDIDQSEVRIHNFLTNRKQGKCGNLGTNGPLVMVLFSISAELAHPATFNY